MPLIGGGKSAYHMKPILNTLLIGVVGITVLLATGCKSVTTTSSRNATAPTHAAVDPSTVQILQVNPARPFVRLGEVRVQTSSLKVTVPEVENALRKEAAKMGADAVVVTDDKTQLTGAQEAGGRLERMYSETDDRVAVGVAIKFK